MSTFSTLFSSRLNDPRQAVRMFSYSMAVGTSVLVVLLLGVWNLLGMMRTGPLCVVLAAVCVGVVAFYCIFRLGWNLRASDASLTVPQMAVASVTLLGAAYAADGGRAIFLVLLAMVSLFGALRLRTAMLMRYALSCVAGYAGVIGLLHVFKPERLDLQLELLQLLVFAVTMPWFALMGGYISELREQLKSAFRTVTESERALAEAQRLAQFGSWTFDPASSEAVWSEETYRIFGLDPSARAIGGSDFRSLVHEEDRERYSRLIDKALGEGQEFDTEYRVALPSGAVRWVHALAQPISQKEGKGQLLRGTVMDITQRKATEEQIRHLAHFDALTGLPNRNLLMQLLRHAVGKAQRGTPLAVLFIDLDGFKAVNDSLGHEIGDALLAAFAQRLSRSLRMSDTAARLGGDEFVVVVDDFENRTHVQRVAERILLAATTPFQVDGHACEVSASIGIAVQGPESPDVDALIKNADTAMYAAKRAGRNRFRFWEPAGR
jgi:diguanylate cyclase (GGDEF)-like protein/PAS domain S-box-containing protein